MTRSNIIRIDTFPVSTNNMYAGRRIMTKVARDTKEAIAWEANAGFSGKPLTGRLHVEVHLFYKNKQRRDIDNLKMLLDALTGIVYEDDSQIDDLHMIRHIDAGDPRIMISVHEI